jgi:hypothetical protein
MSAVDADDGAGVGAGAGGYSYDDMVEGAGELEADALNESVYELIDDIAVTVGVCRR